MRAQGHIIARLTKMRDSLWSTKSLKQVCLQGKSGVINQCFRPYFTVADVGELPSPPQPPRQAEITRKFKYSQTCIKQTPSGPSLIVRLIQGVCLIQVLIHISITVK